MEAIMSADKDALVEIDEIGERIAESIIYYLSQTRNLQLIEKLEKAGLQFHIEEIEGATDTLGGAAIVVSGVFVHHDRSEIKKLIEKHGGKVSSSISKKTAFIVAGDKMGPSKKEKAEKLGVEIISEDEFLAKIKG
jgi:DNA ligase (NAD+)